MFKLTVETPGYSSLSYYPVTLERIEQIVGMMQDDQTITITIVQGS